MNRLLRLPPPPTYPPADLPVYRNYRMADGTTHPYVTADYEHRYREHLMSVSIQPSWRSDPTYNLQRKPKWKPLNATPKPEN